MRKAKRIKERNERFARVLGQAYGVDDRERGLSVAQIRVYRAIKAGEIRTLRTGTRDGNIAQRLIDQGLVTSEAREFCPSSVGPNGRRFSSFVTLIRLSVA